MGSNESEISTSNLTEAFNSATKTGSVSDRNRPGHKSAQIVFRVDYSRSTPIGLVYLTHRVVYAEKK